MTISELIPDRTNESPAESTSRFGRYAIVTLVASPTNLLAFWLVLQLTAWHPTIVNFVVASFLVPATYLVYRHWVWTDYRPRSLRADVARFWTVSVVNVTGASVGVAAAENLGANNIVTTASLFGSYAALWLARFVYLDRVQFKPTDH